MKREKPRRLSQASEATTAIDLCSCPSTDKGNGSLWRPTCSETHVFLHIIIKQST